MSIAKHWKTGLLVGAIIGIILSSAWMAWLRYVSALPAISPASLSVAVSPWWRTSNWISAGIVFLVTGGIVAILVAGGLKRKETDSKRVQRTPPAPLTRNR